MYVIYNINILYRKFYRLRNNNSSLIRFGYRISFAIVNYENTRLYLSYLNFIRNEGNFIRYRYENR